MTIMMLLKAEKSRSRQVLQIETSAPYLDTLTRFVSQLAYSAVAELAFPDILPVIEPVFNGPNLTF